MDTDGGAPAAMVAAAMEAADGPGSAYATAAQPAAAAAAADAAPVAPAAAPCAADPKSPADGRTASATPVRISVLLRPIASKEVRKVRSRPGNIQVPRADCVALRGAEPDGGAGAAVGVCLVYGACRTLSLVAG
jgi:hypothetical protein